MAMIKKLITLLLCLTFVGHAQAGVSLSGIQSGVSKVGSTDYTQDANVLFAYTFDANDCTDDSPNSYNGTASGNATTSTNGKYGSCVVFDGDNDWYTLASTPYFTGSHTVVVWVKRVGDCIDGWWNNGQILNIGTGSPNYYRNYGLQIADSTTDGGSGSVGGAVTVNDINAYVTGSSQVVATTNCTNDIWMHVATVHDATNDTLKIYVNGIEEDSVDDATDTLYASPSYARIGSEMDPATFNGYIDELGGFQRILSTTEIQEIMNHGLRGDR
jgi:hypothetical protein